MKALGNVPAVAIELDGFELPAGEMRPVATIQVKQALSVPSMCELTLVDPPGPLTAAWRTTVGAPLTIRVGRERLALFEGEITAISHSYSSTNERTVHLRAYDQLHRLKKRQSVRSFVDVTVEDIVRELTSDLDAYVTATTSGPTHRFLIQHDRSDLQLLVELAQRCGLYLQIVGDELRLMTLDGVGDEVALKVGDTLLEATVEANSDPVCRQVRAVGWDPGLVEEHSADAGTPRVGRLVVAETPPDAVGGSGERTLAGAPVPADDHLEGMAQAELDVRVAREVSIWGTADGDPRLVPGAPIDVRGVAQDFEGRYVIADAEHVIDHSSGYTTTFSTEPPAPPRRRPGPTVTFGIVEQIDDPDELARVKVSLPAFDGLLSDWMPVLFIGAGAGKGLVALPDAGDRVLVACPDGDPGSGVVLGSLYGSSAPYDSGIDSGAVRRFTLRTPAGLQVQLDDSRRAMKLMDPTGNSVELSPDLFSLSSAVDFHIDAPGKAIVISAKTVDFKKA